MEYCKQKYQFFNLDFDYLLYAHTLQILVFPYFGTKVLSGRE